MSFRIFVSAHEKELEVFQLVMGLCKTNFPLWCRGWRLGKASLTPGTCHCHGGPGDCAEHQVAAETRPLRTRKVLTKWGVAKWVILWCCMFCVCCFFAGTGFFQVIIWSNMAISTLLFLVRRGMVQVQGTQNMCWQTKRVANQEWCFSGNLHFTEDLPRFQTVNSAVAGARKIFQLDWSTSCYWYCNRN